MNMNMGQALRIFLIAPFGVTHGMVPRCDRMMGPFDCIDGRVLPAAPAAGRG